MSKEKRYYLKNRDAILEKRKAKAAADKLEKEKIKFYELEIVKSKMSAINRIGENIYETIIDDGYRKDTEAVLQILSHKIDEKCDVGGITHLEILADYLALNDIKFDIRNYPWAIIRDKFNSNFSYYVENKRVYYTNLRKNKSTVKNPVPDDKGDMALYKHICQLIWDHNKTSDEKWNSGLINPNLTCVELNDILNLVYSGTYGNYK